ncbi:phosphoesterase [Candidatus Magnetobacterium bavaricum]|uniref:Phosphoesterase n=1 Tax=Candidatus Magnetobacterium bavaricum TaxID=29290 RepID=A0A0F3GS08_9BACT|nr:phosphoesterase [Candidatus Magnetobacterium bavaricum]
MFYKVLRRESFIHWLLFQLQHFKKRDFYEYATTNEVLVIIKSELALKFLKLNDYRPAFNYLHGQILAFNKDIPNKGFTRFLSQLADYKIESYFYKYEKHFFKRIRTFEEQVRILTFYKGRRLLPRVELIVNRMLQRALGHNGFPRHVVSDYIPIEPIRDHGLFLTIMAYSHMRRTQVVLRCIPHRYRQPYEFVIEQKRFVMIHEHFNISNLTQNGSYDFLIYGHTHKPSVEKIGQTIVLNPGETCGVKHNKPTVALLDTTTAETHFIKLVN